jgi:hypothetical protein
MSSSGPASTDAPCIHCRLADQSMTWPRALLIARDGSPHTDLGLYPDDILRLVRVLQVVGGRGAMNCTKIEIFACVR